MKNYDGIENLRQKSFFFRVLNELHRFQPANVVDSLVFDFSLPG